MHPQQDKGLAGPRIRFDRLSLDNIYTHFKWNNDPELNRLDSEVPYVKESFGEFKHRFEQLVDRPDSENLDFEIHVGETLIGVAFIQGISDHHLHCSIGLTIGDRDYWGRGFGREAMEILMRHCFESLGMHRVTAEAFEYNDAWKRLVEGMGFTEEGVDRDYLFYDGRFFDRVRYAMLSSEYEARPDRPFVRRKPAAQRKAPGAAA